MKREHQSVLATLAAALLIAGCASTGGLSTQASLQDANKLESTKTLAQVKVAPAAWPTVDWWTRFDDPQLDALVKEALTSSPTLREAQARVRKAQALVGQAASTLAPQVDGSLSSTRQRFSRNDLVPPPLAGTWNSHNQATLDFSYEFDFWGKNHAALASAVGQANAAEVDAFATRLMLSVAIARAYVELQRAYNQLDIAEDTLKQRENVFELTRQRVDSGLDSRVELKQAEAAIPATREQIAALNETADLTRNQLAALLGQGPDRGLTIARPKAEGSDRFALPSQLPAELIGRRPDVVAQRWRVEAAAKDIDVAKAEFYPNVNLTAFIGLQSIGISQFLSSGSGVAGIGPALSLPIFNGGRLRSNLAARDADYDIAVERYNQTLVTALREVADQLVSYRAVATQRGEQRIALQTSQEAYDLSVLRYREGVGNYLQVLSAEAQVLSQKSLSAELDARGLDVSLGLINVLGGGYEPPAKVSLNPSSR